MKINNLNGVQNFSGLQNITSNNQLTKPELKNNEVSETQTPQKQMVNSQMFLASMPNCSFKGGNNKECQELIDSVVSFINIENEKQKARIFELFNYKMNEQEYYSSPRYIKQHKFLPFKADYDFYKAQFFGSCTLIAKVDDIHYNQCLELIKKGVDEQIVMQLKDMILNEKQQERTLKLSQSYYKPQTTNIIFSDNDTQFDIGLSIIENQILKDDDINKISEFSAQFGKNEQTGERFIQIFNKLEFNEEIGNATELLYDIYNISISNDSEYKKIIEQLDKGETTDNIINYIKQVSDKHLDEIIPNSEKLNDKDRLFLKSHAFDNEFYTPNEYASLFLYLKNLKTPNGENILNCESYMNKIDKYGLGDFTKQQETLIYSNIEKLLSIDPSSKKANYIQTILELVKKGEVNSSAFRMLSDFNDVDSILEMIVGYDWNLKSQCTDWDVSNNLKNDIELIRKNETYIKSYKNEKDGIKNNKIGDAFILDGEDYIRIKTDENKSEIVKLTKETYERLFPPVERFLSTQQIMGNCYFIETLMSMYCDDKMRINLLKNMEEDKDGNITIKIGNYKPVTFEKGKMPENEPSEIYSNGADGFKLFEYAYSCALVEDKIKEAQENLEGEQLIEFNNFIKSHPNNFFIYKDNDEIKWTTYEKAIEQELYKENSNNPFGGKSYKTFNNFLLGNGGLQQDVYKKFGLNSEMYFNIPEDLGILPTKDKEDLNSLEVTGKIEEAEELINTPGFFKNNQVQMGIGCHAYNLTQEKDENGNTVYYLYNPHNQGFPVKIGNLHDLFGKVNSVTICNKIN